MNFPILVGAAEQEGGGSGVYSYRRISAENGLADVVGKVERVANERHPAEEVGQAEDPEARWHVDDGPQVLGQGRDRLLGLLALLHRHRALKTGR
jgi:hypothetical protein